MHVPVQIVEEVRIEDSLKVALQRTKRLDRRGEVINEALAEMLQRK